MKKVKAYEILLLDLAPELDNTKQNAIQRGLMLVSSLSSITMVLADSSRSPQCLNTTESLSPQKPELTPTVVIPVKIADLQHLVLAQWVQQVTWITMISSRQH